jgi:hypothetical protein
MRRRRRTRRRNEFIDGVWDFKHHWREFSQPCHPSLPPWEGRPPRRPCPRGINEHNKLDADQYSWSCFLLNFYFRAKLECRVFEAVWP